jgi:2-phospho-L-lactate guanylyltransferase
VRVIAALVPVKRLATGKTRLARDLDRAALASLVLAMLEDVVGALAAVPGLDCVAVVTPDPQVGAAARRLGARALLEPAPGLGPSIDSAARRLAAEGAAALLVVLGDVPGARPEELARMLDALRQLGGRGVVLAPSRDGGTAALLRAPHDLIGSRFGPESAEAHRDLAKQAGVAFRELALPSLAIDIDSREDLEAFLASPSGGPRTRDCLRALGFGAGA